MSSEEKDNLAKELDSKLEDLFDEDTLGEEPEPAPKPKPVNSSKEGGDKSIKTGTVKDTVVPPAHINIKTNFPLDNLNAILLSLDWEITEELIHSYLMEIKKLRSEYATDKYCDYFFRILDNLGRYIKKNLGSAHPESVTMMQSIHQGLENIFLNSEISDPQKKKVFYKEYNRYLKFKKKISQRKNGKAVSQKTSQVESEKFAEVFISRISESLRKVVREELEKVKAEIIESVKK